MDVFRRLASRPLAVPVAMSNFGDGAVVTTRRKAKTNKQQADRVQVLLVFLKQGIENQDNERGKCSIQEGTLPMYFGIFWHEQMARVT